MEYSEEEATLHYFLYPLAPLPDAPADAPAEHLPVATTRPETILGDTAVAVHSADPRYAALVGREAVVPCSGGRRVPVIADEAVDPEFGTGALKARPSPSLRWTSLPEGGGRGGSRLLSALNISAR